MVEPDRQHALPLDVLDPGVAAAGAQLLVQVGDRLASPAWCASRTARPVEGSPSAYRSDTLLVGRSTTSKAGTALRPWGRPSSWPVSGVAALEDGLEAGDGCFALLAQRCSAGAVPAAWGLAVAGQVRFVVGGQLAGVVVLASGGQLGHIRHHLPLPPRRRWRQQRTRGALLSSVKLDGTTESSEGKAGEAKSSA